MFSMMIARRPGDPFGLLDHPIKAAILAVRR
jgi:hypothetical protein